jgi:hypothetical protein
MIEPEMQIARECVLAVMAKQMAHLRPRVKNLSLLECFLKSTISQNAVRCVAR